MTEDGEGRTMPRWLRAILKIIEDEQGGRKRE